MESLSHDTKPLSSAGLRLPALTKQTASLLAALGSFLAVTAPQVAAQTGTIQARVTSAETGEILSGVQIAIEGIRTTGVTADDGNAVIRNVSPGTYTISAQRIGWEPARRVVLVRGGETLRLEIQLSAQAVELSAIAVVGQRTGYRAETSNTATRLDIPLSETPQSVTIITASQIRDQASPTLQEALRYAPGVRHELYGIDNRGDWFGLRGSHETTTFLDGQRMSLTGWWGVVRNEPYAFEQIDVLLGPSSIIAGQNDPGGILNMVSKRPEPVASREFGVRVGNYARKEVFTDWTGPLDADGTWLYRLVTLGRDAGTQIEHADEQRVFAAPSLTWRGAAHSITVFGEYQYDRSDNTNAFLGLEGTLNPAPNGPIPFDVFIGEPDWDRYGGTRYRMGYHTEFALGSSLRIRHNLRHDRVDGLLKSMYAAWWDGFVDETGTPSENGQYLNRWSYAEDARSNVTSADLLLDGKLQTGFVNHTVLVGVDGSLDDWNQRTTDVLGTPLNVYDPVYGTSAEPDLEGVDLTENDISRIGVFVQDQLRFAGGVALRFGLRRDFIRNEIVGGETKDDAATSVNIGLLWKGAFGLNPYASYSQSFSPVAGTDAAGEAFEPKRAEQYEVGVKWGADFAPLQASAAFYSIDERNRLVSDPNDINFSVQLGEAQIKGVELETRGAIGDLNLIGSYTYVRVRADAWPWGGAADPDQQMEGFPEHSASAWAVYDLRWLGVPGLSAGGGVRYTGRIGDGTGNVFVPSVTLFDAMLSFDRGPWRVALNANNLANELYLANCLQRGDCWFGPRRSVETSVAFRW